jgi:hypothetical protein
MSIRQTDLPCKAYEAELLFSPTLERLSHAKLDLPLHWAPARSIFCAGGKSKM